jgi:hypothetical protein
MRGSHNAQCHNCYIRTTSAPRRVHRAVPPFINARLCQQAVGGWLMRAHHNAAMRDEVCDDVVSLR